MTTLEPLHQDGWRLKVYGISYERARPRPQLEAAAHENELHHLVFFSGSDQPAELRRGESAGDPIACVWDLSVIAYEREAWIRHVLHGSAIDETALDAYLQDQLSGHI